MIKVISVKQAPADWKNNKTYVYIGRGSKWGNPFLIGRDGDRAEVIQRYKWAIQNGGLRHLQAHLPELLNKILVCYCKPQACHGDVLKEMAEGLICQDGKGVEL
jgi:hypothetical protein